MLTPIRLVGPDQGLCFDRAAGHLYRPSYVDSEGQVLQWDPSFASLIRRSPLADFLADPAYSEHGARVVFTRMEGGREVLADTLGLDQGAKLPRSLHRRLRLAEQRLQAMRGTGRLTPEEEEFLTAFRLPDVAAFPSSYRVKKAGVFSSRRLYVLWGLVPEQARATPTIMIGWGNAAEAGAGSEAGAMGGGQSSGATDEGQGQVLYDDSLGWPKWLEWLVVFLGIALVLLVLWLLFSMLVPDFGAGNDETASERKAPSSAEQKHYLAERKAKLQEDINQRAPSQRPPEDPEVRRLFAVERALEMRKLAEIQEEAARAAEEVATGAQRKAEASGLASDEAAARTLRGQAESKRAEALKADDLADRAYLYPQETLRKERLRQNKRFNDLSQQAEAAKKAAEATGRNEDADKAKQLQAAAEEARRGLPGPPMSPEEERSVRKEMFVTPKSSGQEGEIIVRRVGEDKLEADGVRLLLEAEGNGRKEFKVKGWAFGLSPLIEQERLDYAFPVRPDLSIATPLDLYFEYRGEDGQIHEDCAPFVISGDLEFRLKLDIESATGSPPQPPTAKPKPGA
jgi:hypothetical protein